MNSIETGFITPDQIIDPEQFDAMPKISFIGPPSSGKGTASELVKSRYNFAHTTFSRGIRDHLEYLHGIPQPHSRELLKPTGIQMVEKFGPLVNLRNAMKYLMYDLSQDPQIQGFAIDGFRWPQEGEAISQLKNSVIVWVESDQEVRKQRLLERARPGDLTEIDFYETDNMEIEWTNPLKQFASATITNNGDLAALESQVKSLIEARFNLEPLY